MRISDWGSDVCSSDLAAKGGHARPGSRWGALLQEVRHARPEARSASSLGSGTQEVGGALGDRDGGGLRVAGGDAGHGGCIGDPHPLEQTGRGPCRAREWPAVKVRVIAVSTKKK